MRALYHRQDSADGFSVSLAATYDHIDRVCQDLIRYLDGHALRDLSFGLQLGVREALANAVRHGARENAALTIDFLLRHEKDGGLTITVRDPGPGFDLAAYEQEKEQSLGLGRQLKDCGRGLAIMRHYFDEVSFSHNGTQVTLRKAPP